MTSESSVLVQGAAPFVALRYGCTFSLFLAANDTRVFKRLSARLIVFRIAWEHRARNVGLQHKRVLRLVALGPCNISNSAGAWQGVPHISHALEPIDNLAPN